MAQRGQKRQRPTGGIIAKLLVVFAVAGAGLAPTLFALPTVSVNSTRDLPDANAGDGVCDTGAISGQTECTLRAAIQEANSDPAPTTVSFAIPTTDGNHAGGIWTIAPTNGLPAITTPTTIDATSQPGWAGEPVIVLDGNDTGGGTIGLEASVDAAGSQFRGLSIVRFAGDGIRINVDDAVVAQNFIGIYPDGSSGQIGDAGVYVTNGATGVIVGGSQNEGNIIGSTQGAGIRVNDLGTSVEVCLLYTSDAADE